MPTVTSPSMAFLGIQYPQHSSGKSKVQSNLYPGALQPQTSVSVTSPSMAFPNVTYPQHSSGKTKVSSYIFPGALQPPMPPAVTLMAQIVT